MTVVARTSGRIHASSWHETHREATDLAERLKALGPWAGMIVITRGGLVPAAIVARVLGIRLIDTICLASYEREVKGPVQTLKRAPAEIGEGEGWLLVDDVADSGATAEEARRQLPKAHYAALYVKPAARPFVDTFLREVGQDVWIDFPWDRDPHVPDR
jgi:xanthine phosphoribosyltransferase